MLSNLHGKMYTEVVYGVTHHGDVVAGHHGGDAGHRILELADGAPALVAPAHPHVGQPRILAAYRTVSVRYKYVLCLLRQCKTVVPLN